VGHPEIQTLNPSRAADRPHRDDDLVFGHPVLGTVLDASALRKRFTTTLMRAKVRRVRFHDLRHTFGTQAAATGVPLHTLQEWMGHRDYKTTLIYADYAPRTHEKSLMERAFAPAERAPFSEHDGTER
jgi:integrase